MAKILTFVATWVVGVDFGRSSYCKNKSGQLESAKIYP